MLTGAHTIPYYRQVCWTRKPTPRELISLLHSYGCIRPHKSASPRHPHSSLRPEANKNPRDRRPQSGAPRSELWHLGPSGQSPDRCSAPPRLRIIPHGPRPPGCLYLLHPRPPPPHDARNRSAGGDPLRPREPDPKPLVRSPGI
jgi:hypothetical protein